MTTVHSPDQPHSSTVRLFFGLTIGLGAGLLFWQQLLIGREMLPKFGGVPAVWLVSLAAFQTILLGAYAFAHSLRDLGRGKILALILVLAALAAAQRLLRPELVAPENITPLAVLIALASMAGLSLFLLSMISPLMQGLYARLPQKDAHDPYFFYSASNFGSFAGLLLFPLALEPLFGVKFSEGLWLGCAGLFVACLIIGMLAAKGMPEAKVEKAVSADRSRWPQWLFYAFLPSALSFGATAHLINDIAPVPLLSMVPLALYLLTFVVAFGKPAKWQEAVVGAQAFLVAFYIYRLVGSDLKPTQALDLVIVLIVFFVTALKFHRMLAASRPPSSDLTFYYLIVALGGALGAIVNVAVIPFILPLPFEFAIFLLISLLPSWKQDWAKLREARNWKLHLILFFFAAFTIFCTWEQASDDRIKFITLPFLVMTLVLASMRPAVLAFLSAIFIVLSVCQLPHTLVIQRDFFGVKRILEGEYPNGKTYRALYHGTTFHGGQQRTPEISTEPLFYYGKGSGFYDVVQTKQAKRIGIIGMGAASNACLPLKDFHVHFFEIDPGMADLARKYFTFLDTCPPDITLGDGRLMLEKDTGQYDMIMLDAFSSDTIPVHLLTREAFDIYRQHLAENGLITVHISNRYLDLRPVVAAAAARFGWQAAQKFYIPPDGTSEQVGSEYTALSPDPALINRLVTERGWLPLDIKPLPWTDDKLSLVPLIKIFRKTPDAQTH